MSTSSTNKLLDGLYADDAAVRAVVLESHLAGDLRVDRVVFSDAGVQAGAEASSALADDDRAAGHEVAVVGFDAEPLRVRVAAVAGAALSFFMSHSAFTKSTVDSRLHQNVFDSHAREDRAVAPGPAHALAALLLEHADLRPARLALDDRDDAGVGDERRTGEDVAAVLFDEQHLFERQFGPGFTDGAVYQHDAPWRDLQLTPAALDDRVHSLPLLLQETPSL